MCNLFLASEFCLVLKVLQNWKCARQLFQKHLQDEKPCL